MPCDSSHMEPNAGEINRSKVLALLQELRTGKLPKYYGNGMYSEVYCQSTAPLDAEVRQLCEKLKTQDAETPGKIKHRSLEMQMWWRDHQRADEKRKKEETREANEKEQKAAKKIQSDTDREKALKKLTPHERKILGI